MTGYEESRSKNGVKYLNFDGQKVAFFEVFGKQWAVNIKDSFNEDVFILQIKKDLLKELISDVA
jgi:hypothetical protein